MCSSEYLWGGDGKCNVCVIHILMNSLVLVWFSLMCFCNVCVNIFAVFHTMRMQGYFKPTEITCVLNTMS